MKKTISIDHSTLITAYEKNIACTFNAIYIGNYDLSYTNLSAYLSELDLATQSF